MARYDKYDPISGGFRAPLNADLTATEDTTPGNPLPVKLNSSGKVIPATGAADAIGLLCTTKNMKANDIVDVMTAGEIVELSGTTPTYAAGTTYYTGAAAAITASGPAAAANAVKLGYTVEATRMVVRVEVVQG